MRLRDFLVALAVSFGAGLAIGGYFAFYDWRLNPGGIFRGPDGTNWTVFFDTLTSWLLPVSAGVFVPTSIALVIARHLRNRRRRRLE